MFTPTSGSDVRLRLYVQSMSVFSVPLNNWLNAVLCCCLQLMLKRSKVPLTKAAMLMVRVNEALL